VRAAELYNKIIREELGSDAPDAFRDAQAQASEELSRVKPRLSHLTVRVEGGEDQRVIVTMDGTPIASALVGVERPVDPGTHELQATADGFQSALSRITLAEAQREQVVLTLMPKPGVTVAQITGETPAEAAPAQTPASQPTAPAPVTPQQDRGSSGSGGMRVGSYVAFGVGAVGIGLGTFFTLQSSSKRSEADDLAEQCGPDCRTTDPEAEEIASLDDEARSAQTLGIVGFIAGGVGVATGVTLLLLSGGSESETARNEPGITPWVGLGSVGVLGRF
jgi:hypothetical protein